MYHNEAKLLQKLLIHVYEGSCPHRTGEPFFNSLQYTLTHAPTINIKCRCITVPFRMI